MVEVVVVGVRLKEERKYGRKRRGGEDERSSLA